MYRVMVLAEDGAYCLKDGFRSYRAAEAYMNKQKASYGEGQELFVEEDFHMALYN